MSVSDFERYEGEAFEFTTSDTVVTIQIGDQGYVVQCASSEQVFRLNLALRRLGGMLEHMQSQLLAADLQKKEEEEVPYAASECAVVHSMDHCPTCRKRQYEQRAWSLATPALKELLKPDSEFGNGAFADSVTGLFQCVDYAMKEWSERYDANIRTAPVA